MRLETKDNNFTRFLKDEKYIKWRLLPTEELNAYWDNYLQEYPRERKDILLANIHLKKTDVFSPKMLPVQKNEAIYRLEKSLSKYNYLRRMHWFIFVASAACIAVLILSILFFHKGMSQFEKELITSSDYIVGSELESEDIMFITSKKTVFFKNNIDIQIDGNKTAQVKSEQAEPEGIPIENNSMNKLVVPYGKQSRITLADGTKVWLNSGSSLEFPSTFSEEIREIYLTGEMYIEVTPDIKKPFYVHTSAYNVKVYGTKLNISSYIGNPSSVVLVEGSVGLQSKNGQELLLSPNEQATYSAALESFDTCRVDVNSFISWKEGYLTFEETPVIQALKQIERYYNLSFNYDKDIFIRELTCTGKIILSDNIDNVMTALTLISSTKYKKENNYIYIYKE